MQVSKVVERTCLARGLLLSLRMIHIHTYVHSRAQRKVTVAKRHVRSSTTNAPQPNAFTSIGTPLKVHVIEKERTTDQQCLVFQRCFVRKGNIKGIGIGQTFGPKGLGSLENLAQMRGLEAMRIFLIRCIDPKGKATAAITTTRIAFCKTLIMCVCT